MAITRDEFKKIYRYYPNSGIIRRRKTCKKVGTVVCNQLSVYALGRQYAARDLAWLYMTGALPTKADPVVFKDGNRLNTSFKNLCLKSKLDRRQCKSKTHESCGKFLPLSDFCYDNRRGIYYNLCHKCRYKIDREKRKQNKVSLRLLRATFRYNKDTGILLRGERSVGIQRPDGYVEVNFRYHKFLLHRLIWWLVTGDKPHATQDIDHINHVRNDNRWENLRLVSRLENTRNAEKQKRNTSGVVGVYYNKNMHKWMASIGVEGKQVHLGYFSSKDRAIIARKNAEITYGFHFNHGKTLTGEVDD